MLSKVQTLGITSVLRSQSLSHFFAIGCSTVGINMFVAFCVGMITIKNNLIVNFLKLMVN